MASNVSLHGTLIESLPCTIKAGDDKSEVNLGNIFDNYLYQNHRTAGKLFTLHLENCDTEQAKNMTIVFSGQENAQLPGLLAPAPGSQGRGIGIGIETALGEKIALNQTSDAIELNEGNNVISLRAYVAGEPAAISEKKITPGSFTAIATFKFDYF